MSPPLTVEDDGYYLPQPGGVTRYVQTHYFRKEMRFTHNYRNRRKSAFSWRTQSGSKTFLSTFIPSLAYNVIRREREFTDGISGYPGNYASNFNSFGPLHFDTDRYRLSEEKARRSYFANASKLTSANIGVSVAELKESFGMIAKTALKLTTAGRQLKRGNIIGAAKALVGGSTIKTRTWGTQSHRNLARKLRVRNKKDKRKGFETSAVLSSNWLELQFGWMPLLKDIHDIAKTTADHFHAQTPEMVIIRGVGEVVGGIKSSSPSNVNASGFASVTTHYITKHVIDDMDGYVKRSFGLSNPTSVAWELVPFSFVADWFLPIGDMIESWSAQTGLSRIDACKSVKVNFKGSGVSINPIYPCGVKDSYTSFKRTTEAPPSSYPLPSVDFKQMVSPWKMITSLALIKQVFS